MYKLVLASASPRRRQLLGQIGAKFEVIESDVDESAFEKSNPVEYVRRLSYEKANSVAKRIEGSYLVIGADTIVTIDEEILGKPKNNDDAFQMIRKLNGRIHKVITAVTVINVGCNDFLTEHVVSNVKMRDISDEEIYAYIESGEPADKAGSYAIQGMGAIFIEYIEGSYTSIVGLPIYNVYNMLKHYGFSILGK